MGWKDIYRRAFELALDATAVTEAAEALLELGVTDRGDFDAARFHYAGQIADFREEWELRLALEYVREAIRRGDASTRWTVWGRVDPWEAALYRTCA